MNRVVAFDFPLNELGNLFLHASSEKLRVPSLISPPQLPTRIRGQMFHRILLTAISTVFLSSISIAAEDALKEAARRDFFESKIRPVLVAQCYECHSSDAKQVGGELKLDSGEALRAGGESGSAIELGDADGSLLMEAIRYEGLEMPPSGKLPDDVIADFAHWINDGAFDPREPPEQTANATSNGTDSSTGSVDVEAGRAFWSFQPPMPIDPPETSTPDWATRKIDHFVLAKLEEVQLTPAEQASRRTLVRRLFFDVIGLPPTTEQVEDFVSDTRPDAHEQLVERLLASPQYGARWARLWLDIARYAEDQAHIVGNNKELFYPNAWKYRDWLINAFNRDLPYDQFVRLQLAADLLDSDSNEDAESGEESNNNEDIVALGFLGIGPKYYRRNAPEVMADEWEDRVDTVTRGLLGLTVACARCHDHKYDPIPTEDYYGLAGVFASTKMYNLPPADWKPTEKKKKPDPAETLHIVKDGKARDLKVHIRGDAFNEGDVVPRRFVSVLASDEVPLQTGSGRKALADAIASTDNPLTARVIVNRIWGEYFGKPIVATPSNFGKLGQAPTHPQLLDDLAYRFMHEGGWSLKWLHREIVLSATYQQSSLASEKSLHVDPTNRLISRMPRRRLSIEQWRDAMLSVSGKLNEVVGGTSQNVEDPTTTRRTVYSKVSRLELNAMLKLFDYPDPNVHAARRAETTTPLQKLFALNSPFMAKRAEQLAERITQQSSADRDRVNFAYQTLFAREPEASEMALAIDFLSPSEAANSETIKSRWSQYAQILLATNEMMYLD